MAKDVRRRPHCVQPREVRSELENSGEVDSLTLKMISGHGGARSKQKGGLRPGCGSWIPAGDRLRFEVRGPGTQSGRTRPSAGFFANQRHEVLPRPK